MACILMFTSGPDDWQVLLADRKKHWKTGYSARTLAHCWEAVEGFPPEVEKALQQTDEPSLREITPLLAIPEFEVPLPGGVRSSQNDLFVLARGAKGPVSIMVEGKVCESFGPTLDAWRGDASEGKEQRLRFLLRTRPDWGAHRLNPLSASSSRGFGGDHRRAVSGGCSRHAHSLIQ